MRPPKGSNTLGPPAYGAPYSNVVVTHAGQIGPPQSTPVSAPLVRPSLHVAPGVLVVFGTVAVVVVVGMAVVVSRPVHSHGNVHLGSAGSGGQGSKRC